MDKFRNYDVAFSGLKNGKHELTFNITQEFFDLFETEQEFTDAQIEAKVFLEKHTTFLDFLVKIKGTVNLICDISNEEFTNPIENEIKIPREYKRNLRQELHFIFKHGFDSHVKKKKIRKFL